MAPIIDLLSLIIFLFWIIKGVDLIVGHALYVPNVKKLDGGHAAGDVTPKVSIIFGTRDEGPTVREAIETMLAQDYPSFEVIAVDDRSSEAHRALLRSFEGKKNFKLVQVDHLEEGWLGKTHALYRGYLESTGEWLLFTDADVRFHPHAIHSAMHAVRKWHLHHLTLFPRLIVKNYLETLFISVFTLAFNLYYRPWHARFPSSRSFCGIGAFNFVNREAYETIGTHKKISFQIADDVMLGKRIKQHGFKQLIAFGYEIISVRWVEGFSGIINSLKKNAFAGFHYRMSLLFAATLASLILNVLPFCMIFISSHPFHLYACGTAIWIIFLIYLERIRYDRWTLLAFLGYPIGSLLLLVVLWVSAISVLRQGGVNWRDTFYPLKELRKHHAL